MRRGNKQRRERQRRKNRDARWLARCEAEGVYRCGNERRFNMVTPPSVKYQMYKYVLPICPGHGKSFDNDGNLVLTFEHVELLRADYRSGLSAEIEEWIRELEENKVT